MAVGTNRPKTPALRTHHGVKITTAPRPTNTAERTPAFQRPRLATTTRATGAASTNRAHDGRTSTAAPQATPAPRAQDQGRCCPASGAEATARPHRPASESGRNSASDNTRAEVAT